MLIVLTSEQEIKNEAMLLNQLFETGLEVLHLRKPSFTEDGYRELLNTIEPRFYKRIMIHEHHHLCKEFDLKGIHIQEQPRLNLGEGLRDYMNGYRTLNYVVSSSFHEPEVLKACEAKFDYHLLSPVFSSISKQGYEGRGFDVNHIDKTIIGMGGINETTIPETLQLGFKGVGVLGGVWNTNDPIQSFLTLNKAYTQTTIESKA